MNIIILYDLIDEYTCKYFRIYESNEFVYTEAADSIFVGLCGTAARRAFVSIDGRPAAVFDGSFQDRSWSLFTHISCFFFKFWLCPGPTASLVPLLIRY